MLAEQPFDVRGAQLESGTEHAHGRERVIVVVGRLAGEQLRQRSSELLTEAVEGVRAGPPPEMLAGELERHAAQIPLCRSGTKPNELRVGRQHVVRERPAEAKGAAVVVA